ncbi:MAG: HdeD family acid-resistance protein [Arachnia sp.]
MAETINTPKGAGVVNGIRTAFGLGGIASLIMGIVILVWPAPSAAVVTIMVAIYAAIAGLANLGVGIFTRDVTGWRRVGYLALGVLFLIAAIVALVNLGLATAALLSFIAIMVGFMWIVDGVIALTTLGDAASKGWAIAYGIISLIAGSILVFSPLIGGVSLLLLLGIGLVALGIIQIVRGFTFGNRR